MAARSSQLWARSGSAGGFPSTAPAPTVVVAVLAAPSSAVPAPSGSSASRRGWRASTALRVSARLSRARVLTVVMASSSSGVGGALQALGQGDNGGQGVPHGVVELAGHARLAAGGVALRHEPVLGGLGGEQGVAVLQGLPAGPGGGRRGDDDGEQEDLRRDPADEGGCEAGRDRGEGPAGEDHEQADNALGRPRNDAQGVEGHQRRDREGRVLRPPQAHARADQAGQDDGRERPAAPAEQGRGDEQGEPQQRSDISPGLDDQDPARDEQLEQAHDECHRPQRRGGRAPSGGEPVQGGSRHPRDRGPRAAGGRCRRARGFARGHEPQAAGGRRAHETRPAARRSAVVHTRAQAAAMAEASAMDPMEAMLPGSREVQAAVMSDSG